METSEALLPHGKLRHIALLSASNGRELWRSLDSTGRELLTVQARSIAGLRAVRRERALISALAADSVSAAPRIMHTTWGSYSLENVHELSLSSGRRMGSPSGSDGVEPGSEHVRLDLLDLLSELHTRSLTLNLAGARGVGFRADGSVVVTDFSRIADASFTRVRADTRWVDSLVAGAGNVPGTVARRSRRDDGADETGQGSEAATPRLVYKTRSAPNRGGIVNKYRMQILTAGCVVAASTVLAVGVTHIMHPSATAEAHPTAVPPKTSEQHEARTAQASPPSSKQSEIDASVRERSLPDAQATLKALASERYDYLTGHSPSNAAVAPGSPAASADAKIRNAYRGGTVSGGETVIHEAAVVSRSQEGTATLEATVSETATTHVAKNETREAPATDPHPITLQLVYDGARWTISEVTSF